MGGVSIPTDAERIARRYPPPALPRWTWVAVAVAIAAVGLPWLFWSAWHGANPAIAAKLVSFVVTSDTTVDARITVERPDPAVPGVCTLKAQAVSYETVGQLDVVVGAGTERLVDVDVTLRTFKPATSVSVVACRTTG